jgi:hypothetical protein
MTFNSLLSRILRPGGHFSDSNIERADDPLILTPEFLYKR